MIASFAWKIENYIKYIIIFKYLMWNDVNLCDLNWTVNKILNISKRNISFLNKNEPEIEVPKKGQSVIKHESLLQKNHNHIFY